MEDLRREHDGAPLNEADVAADPLVQFDRWFTDAVARDVREPDALTLATATAAGGPTARTVVLRAWDARGLVFFTNYDSAKARDLDGEARAAMVFHWREMSRQVRAVGRVERVDEGESDRYFASRPLPSRLAAWASAQSDVVASRAELDAAYAEVESRLGDDPPRPPFWGGYRLAPDEMEFWQGRPSRLHDRLRYRRAAEGWVIDRLWP